MLKPNQSLRFIRTTVRINKKEQEKFQQHAITAGMEIASFLRIRATSATRRQQQRLAKQFKKKATNNKDNDFREQHIHIRFSQTEFTQAKKCADFCAVDFSKYIRGRGLLYQPYATIAAPTINELCSIHEELNEQGRQFARYVRGESTAGILDIDIVSDQLNIIYKITREIIRQVNQKENTHSDWQPQSVTDATDANHIISLHGDLGRIRGLINFSFTQNKGLDKFNLLIDTIIGTQAKVQIALETLRANRSKRSAQN